MNHTLRGEERRGGRGAFHGRRRWRIRPRLQELEARTLLSTIVVNNPTDTPVTGLIDLRQAIVQANTNGGAETIKFDRTVFNTPQTIDLDPTLGQLELNGVTGTEIIMGPNAGVTVDGNAATRLFAIGSGAKVTISGLTLTDGLATDGAAVLNAGNLTLTQDVLSASVAQGVAGGGLFGDGAARGGGVENEAGATLTVSKSTFTGDLALGGAGGAGGTGASGGVGGAGQGGGLCMAQSYQATSLSVTNSTITLNQAIGGAGGAAGGMGGAGEGGGLFNSPAGDSAPATIPDWQLRDPCERGRRRHAGGQGWQWRRRSRRWHLQRPGATATVTTSVNSGQPWPRVGWPAPAEA